MKCEVNVYAVASSLHPDIRGIIDIASDYLHKATIEPHFVRNSSDAVSGVPTALCLLTGGTEQRALELARDVIPEKDPVLLLSLNRNNSLAASLEVLARLRQSGRRGLIIMLGGHGCDDELKSTLQCLSGEYRHLLVKDNCYTVHYSARRKMEVDKMGVIGQPSNWLVASTPSPQLLQSRWGTEIVQVPMSEFIDTMKFIPDNQKKELAHEFVKKSKKLKEVEMDDVVEASGVYFALKKIVKRYELSSMTIRCFDIVQHLRTSGCIGVSQVLDDGVICGCEGDIVSTLTMSWIHALTGELPFLSNPQDIDYQRKTVGFAHCTVARRMVKSFSLATHFESSIGVGVEGIVPPGPATITRIGGGLLHEVFSASGDIVKGGKNDKHRCRTQVNVRLPKSDLSYFTERPLGNHHVLVAGHWEKLIKQYTDLFGLTVVE